jgi:hypothetical protein
VLSELIQLWRGGPSVPLGSYFVYVKYVFFLLLAVLALGALRWPDLRWTRYGTLLLASLSLSAFARPLARPYGLLEGAPGLESIGHVMVAASRGMPSEGRLVRQTNPSPLWGLILGAASGFDVERLWKFYSFVPLMTLLLLAVAASWSMNALEQWEGHSGTLSALSIFFVLFLSSHRLSFLEPQTSFWSECFWGKPHLGVGLAVACLLWRFMPGTSVGSSIGGAASVALLGWIEPRLAYCLGIGCALWLGLEARWGKSLALAAGFLLFVPFRAPPSPAELPISAGSWADGVSRLFAVTVDSGLVFLLSLSGLWLLWRSGGARERLLATCTLVGFVLWGLSSFITAAATALEPRIVEAMLRLFVSLTAAYALYRGLTHLQTHHPVLPEGLRFVPRSLRRSSTARIALSAFLVLSLPWCFPFWWQPVRMDPTYVASLTPISGNLMEMADAIRSLSSPDAVFVASRSYAPWIPALAGRRVLLADSNPVDLAARKAAERDFAFSNDPEAIASAASRWGLTHLAWGRLDMPSTEADAPAIDFTFFENSPSFELRFRLRRWVRIYEYRSLRVGAAGLLSALLPGRLRSSLPP